MELDVKTGSVRWAPWLDGEAFQIRTTGATKKSGCVPVRWMEGPLKGREGLLEARTLRMNRRDAEDWRDLE